MAKQKSRAAGGGGRKSRLDKGTSGSSSGEFLGFAAFAVPSADGGGAGVPSFGADSSASSGGGRGGGGGPRPTPIFEGSDPDLHVLFRRIGQKRDATTKCRALAELAEVAFPPPPSPAPPSDATEVGEVGGDEGERGKDVPRQERVAALSHLLYLYTTKLHYDNAPAVRSECLRTLSAAHRHVPKAWRSLLGRPADGFVCGGSSVEAAPSSSSAVGMAFVSESDSAAEVSGAANELIRIAGGEGAPLGVEGIRAGTCGYVRKMLAHGRASGLHDALFGRRGGSGAAEGGGGGKKKKGQDTGWSAAMVGESEREEMEERYERAILACLGGMGLLVESYPEAQTPTDSDGGEDVALYSDLLGSDGVALLWKHLTSSRTTFRRAAYGLLCQASRNAPSLVLGSGLNAIVPRAVVSERDQTNFPPLFDAVLLYLASFKTASKDPWDIDGGVNVSEFVKALCKVLRRGCHGSPAVRWGPGMLPLVASLPWGRSGEGMEHSAAVLRALWDGRDIAVSAADECAVVGAVFETAAFLLLRRHRRRSDDGDCNDDVNADDFADAGAQAEGGGDGTEAYRVIASYVPHGLEYYLSSHRCTGLAAGDLAATISRDLHRLDVASRTDRDDCALSDVQNKLWTDVGEKLRWPSGDSYLGADEGAAAVVAADERREMAARATVLLRGVIKCERAAREGMEADVEGQSALVQGGSHLRPPVRGLVRSVLALSRAAGAAAAMHPAEVEFFIAAADLCGVGDVLAAPSDGEKVDVDVTSDPDCVHRTVEEFCVNDLLRWIVFRTSAGSGSSATLKDVETDFFLLRSCLLSFPPSFSERRTETWSAILREVVAASADLGALARGIAVLSSGDDGDDCGAVLVRCDALDDFAAQVGEVAAEHFRSAATDRWLHRDAAGGPVGSKAEDDTAGMAALLQICAGVEGGGAALVGADTVRRWIDLACGSDVPPVDDMVRENVLLDVLLAASAVAASSPFRAAVGPEETVQLALESWCQGGVTWDRRGASLAAVLLSEEAEKGYHFTERTSESLRKFLFRPEEDITDIAHGRVPLGQQCKAWSDRAWRLLRLRSAELSLDATGLRDVGLWKFAAQAGGSSADRSFLCLYFVMGELNDAIARRNLLLGQTGDTSSSVELFVNILLSQVDMETLNRSFDGRLSRCQAVVTLLGGRNGLGTSFLYCCAQSVVRSLAMMMRDCVNEGTCRGVAILDFLVATLVGAYVPKADERSPAHDIASDDAVKPEDVREGDSLWYKTENGWVSVTVIKIHDDDFPNLYFTVRFEAGNERQTVADKLATKRLDIVLTGKECQETLSGSNIMVTEEEEGMRLDIESLVVKELVKPFLLSPSKGREDFAAKAADAAAECASIVISRCGLNGKAGLGSVRYEVFQLASKLEQLLNESFSTIATSGAHPTEGLLRRMALFLGYGVYSSGSPQNCKLLNFNPDSSMNILLRLFEESRFDAMLAANKCLSSAILMFLTVAAGVAVSKAESLRSSMSLLEKLLAVICFGHVEKSAIVQIGPFLMFLNAVTAVQSCTQGCIDYSAADEDTEKRILEEVLRGFVSLAEQKEDNESKGRVGEGNKEEDPLWLSPFNSLIQQYSGDDRVHHLLSGITENVEGLCDTLFSPSKRKFGFYLLSMLAKEGTELFADENTAMNIESQARLDVWKESLDPEEAEELEDDAYSAARWLPHSLMNEIENWAEVVEHKEQDTDAEVLGRLLSWLICLDFLDGASMVDIRNRSCISSYIDKTGAVREILTLALSHANLNDKQTESWISCTGIEDGNGTLKLPAVSTLAVFRTIESLPTLAKSWWTDDCARTMQNPVNQFVQNLVAPETLRRELARICTAKTLGDLEVNGSCVSREVVATYQQDECQLSVLIRIPPVFPLRNVEVDCQKTLGVAEKRYRRWALQIMKMLNTQDGSILDALLLWKQNVDKEFEGVEPCPVCYSVLCVKTHAMPNLECKTCQNRFHSQCLFKWFQSSGKSQCVLCQQPWSGTKV